MLRFGICAVGVTGHNICPGTSRVKSSRHLHFPATSATLCPVTPEELAGIPFYERVKHVRKDVLGETQEKFAEHFRVDVRTIKGWENPRATRGAPNIANAQLLAKLGGYPEVLFFTPQPFEVTLAQEISRKLDLLLARLGPEETPIPAEEAEAAKSRIRAVQSAAAQAGLDQPRSDEGDA